MANTIPECLTRTSADDRLEAMTNARKPGGGETRATLAAVQRREAEDVTNALPWSPRSQRSTLQAAAHEATIVFRSTWFEREATLAQRATLLDAARALVRLALEIAG